MIPSLEKPGRAASQRLKDPEVPNFPNHPSAPRRFRGHADEVSVSRSSRRISAGPDDIFTTIAKDPVLSASFFIPSELPKDVSVNHRLELPELRVFLSQLLPPELELNTSLWKELESKVLAGGPAEPDTDRLGDRVADKVTDKVADKVADLRSTRISPHELSQRLASYLKARPPTLDGELRMLDQLLADKFRLLERI